MTKTVSRNIVKRGSYDYFKMHGPYVGTRVGDLVSVAAQMFMICGGVALAFLVFQ